MPWSGPNAALPSSTSCTGASRLRDALIDHPLGIRTVVSHRSLNEKSPSKEQLDEMLADVRDDCDIILLDTHPHEPSLVGPMGAADRIVIPTALDILSLRAAALTVGLAQQLDVLDRIRGIVVTNAKRPLSRITNSLLNGLTLSGLAFETVLWYSPGWVVATSGRGELPDAGAAHREQDAAPRGRDPAVSDRGAPSVRRDGAGQTAEAGGRGYSLSRCHQLLRSLAWLPPPCAGGASAQQRGCVPPQAFARRPGARLRPPCRADSAAMRASSARSMRRSSVLRSSSSVVTRLVRVEISSR